MVTSRFQSGIEAGARDEMEAQRARAQTTTAIYKRPRNLYPKSTKDPTTETVKLGPLPATPDAGKSSAPPQIPPPRSKNAWSAYSPPNRVGCPWGWFREGGTLHSIGTIATLRPPNKAHPCHRN